MDYNQLMSHYKYSKKFQSGRRQFIKNVSLSSLGFILLPETDSLNFLLPKINTIGNSENFCTLLDSGNFCYLKFYFINFENFSGAWKRIDRKKKGYLIVRLPQQHIAEEVKDFPINEDGYCETGGEFYSISYISGYSNITIEVYDDINCIESAALLTNWDQLGTLLTYDSEHSNYKKIPKELKSKEKIPLFEKDNILSITDNNVPFTKNVPFTLIEAPFEIYLSPVNPKNGSIRFIPNEPCSQLFKSELIVVRELWQKSLYSGEKLGSPDFRIVAYKNVEYDKFMPHNSERYNLAQLSNITKNDNPNEFEDNRQTTSEYFKISSLGSSAKLKYENANPRGNDNKDYFITKWEQEFELGRDNIVEIQTRAVDLRTGLKVLVTEIAERRIENGRSFLVKRLRFEYLQSIREFAGENYLTFPFVKISAAGNGDYFVKQELNDNCYLLFKESSKAEKLPEFKGQVQDRSLLRQPYDLVDKQGNTFRRDLELIFISEEAINFDVIEDFNANLKNAIKAYNKLIAENYNVFSIPFNGSKIAYVKVEDEKSNDPKNDLKPADSNHVLETEEMQLYSNIHIPKDAAGKDEKIKYSNIKDILLRLKYTLAYIPQLKGIEEVQKARYLGYTNSWFSQEENTNDKFFQVLKDGVEKLGTDIDKFNKFSENLVKEKENFKAQFEEQKAKVTNILTENYNKIGGLVNPDIVIENLSFLKNGLIFAESFNNLKKNLNPMDFLKGLNCELFGGLDLRKILMKNLPIAECPVFDFAQIPVVNEVMLQDKLNEVMAQISELPISNTVKENFEKVDSLRSEIESIKKNIDALKNSIKGYEKELENLISQEIGNGSKQLSTELRKYVENSSKLYSEKKILEQLINDNLFENFNNYRKTITDKVNLSLKDFENLQNAKNAINDNNFLKWIKDSEQLSSFKKIFTDFFDSNAKEHLLRVMYVSDIMSRIEGILIEIRDEMSNLGNPNSIEEKKEGVDKTKEEAENAKKELAKNLGSVYSIIVLERSKLEKYFNNVLRPSDGSPGTYELLNSLFAIYLKAVGKNADIIENAKNRIYHKEILRKHLDDLISKNHKVDIYEYFDRTKLVEIQKTISEYLKEIQKSISKSLSEIKNTGVSNTLSDVNKSLLKINNKVNDELYLLRPNLNGILEYLRDYKNLINSESQSLFNEYMNVVDETQGELKVSMQLRLDYAKNELGKMQNQISSDLKKEIEELKQNWPEFEELNKNQIVQDTFLYYRKLALMYDDMEKGYSKLFDSNIIKEEIEEIKENVKKQVINLNEKLIEEYGSVKSEINDLNKYVYLIESNFNEKIGEIETFYLKANSKVEDALQSVRKFTNKNKEEIEQNLKEAKKNLNKFENVLETNIKEYKTKLTPDLKSATNEIKKVIRSGNESYEKVRSTLKEFESLYDALNKPATQNFNYSWSTGSFEDFDFGFIKFSKRIGGDTKLTVNVNSSMNYQILPSPRLISQEIMSETVLTDFSLSFFKIITVDFKNLKSKFGTNTKSDLSVKIDSVKFEGPLDFVKVFQNFLSTLDKGIRFQFDPDGILIGYDINIPDITGGAFNFIGVKISIFLLLPLRAKVPVRIVFALNSPQDPFVISAGIYGGGGFFQIGLEAKSGVYFISFGLGFSSIVDVNFFVASGKMKVFAGITMSKDQYSIEITAKLNCSGFLKIPVSFVDISLTYEMGLRGNGNYLEGYLELEIKVKISIFLTIPVKFKMSKKLYGTNSNSKSALDLNAQGGRGSQGNKVLEGTNQNDEVSNYITNSIPNETINISKDNWREYIESYF
jgi:hypothetical protein